MPKCYRWQAISMEQGKIRPSVTLYSLDHHYQTYCDWLRQRLLLACQFWLNLVRWGIPREYVKYNPSVTFCSVPFFSCTHLEQKSVNRFAQSMAQNAWNHARMCLLGFCQKIFTPTHNIPQIPKILHYESSFFAQNTYKSWRKCCQNSYSKRK